MNHQHHPHQPSGKPFTASARHFLSLLSAAYGPTYLLLLGGSLSLLLPQVTWARFKPEEALKKEYQLKVQKIVEPILAKYCPDQCKLLGVTIQVDLAHPDSVQPGFDDLNVLEKTELEPAAGSLKILMDEKLGPNSRTRINDLIQEYLDTFNFHIAIENITQHFPQTQGTEAKMLEMRQRISKRFSDVMEETLQQFCPKTCLLGEVELLTERITGDELQNGDPNEFYQEGDYAIRIKDLRASILMDDRLNPQEQANLLEIFKVKAHGFKHVSINARALKFPKNASSLEAASELGGGQGQVGEGRGGLREQNTVNGTTEKNLNSKSEQKSVNETNLSSKAATEKKESLLNDTKTQEFSQDTRKEKLERYEKIERVENGDAVQAQLKTFQFYSFLFAASLLAMLLFIALQVSSVKALKAKPETTPLPYFPLPAPLPHAEEKSGKTNEAKSGAESSSSAARNKNRPLLTQYEVERLYNELVLIFSEQPRIAKHVFSRILTEEGIEVTAQYIDIFGETIVLDLLRDPGLQANMNELVEYYGQHPMELTADQKLELLRKLENRTVASKLALHRGPASQLFDYLSELDGLQIWELIRSESLTVQSIVLTQVDMQKRAAVFAKIDPEMRIQLLTELTRVDYLPRDYIFQVALALKQKRSANPKLNTEALPGSEVLVNLLEKTGHEMQRTVLRELQQSSPENAQMVKNKLLSIETLKYLRDGQLKEVVLSLKHDEIAQFLSGTSPEMSELLFKKLPEDLVLDLREMVESIPSVNHETYLALERKLLNRMKVLIQAGQINLFETNDRMFGADFTLFSPGIPSGSGNGAAEKVVS